MEAGDLFIFHSICLNITVLTFANVVKEYHSFTVNIRYINKLEGYHRLSPRFTIMISPQEHAAKSLMNQFFSVKRITSNGQQAHNTLPGKFFMMMIKYL